MIFLYVLTGAAVIISFMSNPEKTRRALISGGKKLWKIVPPFIFILVSVAIVLYLVPNELIVHYLGGSNSYLGVAMASIIGSITVMPGPIVYPLCRILVDEGVSWAVIAAFSSSLMLVGVLTFPLEKAYFGKKFALIRNAASLIITLIVALIFSLVSGILL